VRSAKENRAADSALAVGLIPFPQVSGLCPNFSYRKPGFSSTFVRFVFDSNENFWLSTPAAASAPILFGYAPTGGFESWNDALAKLQDGTYQLPQIGQYF